jgi:hypothetical protein
LEIKVAAELYKFPRGHYTIRCLISTGEKLYPWCLRV